MAKRKQSSPLTGPLKHAIAESSETFLGLEKATGLKRQTLMKFARGESSLRLDMADKLAAYFGLELVKRGGARR
jgi:hypothetical protein